MMPQLLNILIIVIFTNSFSVLAQIDKSTESSSKGISSGVIHVKKAEKPENLYFDSDNGFKTAGKELEKKKRKKQTEEDLKNKGILTKIKIAEERYLKNFKRINGQFQYPVIDQDLGSVSTESKSVNIICRDFQYPDGDRVTIYINDIPIVANLTLKQYFQSFNAPLEEGINNIKIVALNQGTSGPNTAAFKVYNDAGMLLSSNKWNLAEGAKATLIIAKSK